MEKFEISKFSVEVPNSIMKKGHNEVERWIKGVIDLFPEKVGEFANEKEMFDYYGKHLQEIIDSPSKMSGHTIVHGAYLERNCYNEDNEWIDGSELGSFINTGLFFGKVESQKGFFVGDIMKVLSDEVREKASWANCTYGEYKDKNSGYSLVFTDELEQFYGGDYKLSADDGTTYLYIADVGLHRFGVVPLELVEKPENMIYGHIYYGKGVASMVAWDGKCSIEMPNARLSIDVGIPEDIFNEVEMLSRIDKLRSKLRTENAPDLVGESFSDENANDDGENDRD